jgi:hypothetical protein
VERDVPVVTTTFEFAQSPVLVGIRELGERDVTSYARVVRRQRRASELGADVGVPGAGHETQRREPRPASLLGGGDRQLPSVSVGLTTGNVLSPEECQRSLLDMIRIALGYPARVGRGGEVHGRARYLIEWRGDRRAERT